MVNYLSSIYELTSFGIFKIKNAIVCSDKDDGITIEVSFDGGSTFQLVDKLNTKFSVIKSTGKIQVKITFEDVKRADIYRVKTTGYFQNLEIGTTINFTNVGTGENFKTTIGRHGYYNISIPRGLYELWHLISGRKTTILSSYNPEVTYNPTHRLDKEAIIDGIFRDIEWARYSVFDTFSDRSKMIYGNAVFDSEGDLSDGVTNRKCRWWTVGFE
jgi:hypothetical protein